MIHRSRVHEGLKCMSILFRQISFFFQNFLFSRQAIIIIVYSEFLFCTSAHCIMRSTHHGIIIDCCGYYLSTILIETRSLCNIYSVVGGLYSGTSIAALATWLSVQLIFNFKNKRSDICFCGVRVHSPAGLDKTCTQEQDR